MTAIPLWMIGAALLVGAPVAATAKDTGQVHPKVRWAEGDASSCRYGVLGESRTQPVTSLLELAPGPHQISVRCGDDPELVPPPATVKVRAGRVARPKFDVARAKVRVMTRRGGVMVKADVQFFPVGEAFEAEPISVRASNITARLAAARYDVRVRMKDQGQPAAEVFLRRVKLAPGRNKDLEVDLSDGSIMTRVKANRRRAEGAVRIFAAGTQKQVALGDTEQELRLPAGQYDVTFELRSAANFATKTKTVWIRAGKTTKAEARFKTGKLAVRVIQDREVIPSTVRLSLPLASEFFNFFEAPGSAVLTPGVYNLTVSSASAQPLGDVERRDIEIRAGRTKKVTVDLSQARLRVDVRKNGEPVRADVEVRESGGGVSVAQLDAPEVRLWPGRYEVIAKLPDGTEHIDGPFDITLGERVTRRIDFELVPLTVVAMRGATKEDAAKFLVFRPGASKAIARGRSGDSVEVSAGTYDLKVVSGPDTEWRQGVSISGAKVMRIDLPALDDAESPSTGDEDDDFELPEGDADSE